MGLLIKNGEIVTAADRCVADLYCDDGRIVAIGENRVPPQITQGSATVE